MYWIGAYPFTLPVFIHSQRDGLEGFPLGTEELLLSLLKDSPDAP